MFGTRVCGGGAEVRYTRVRGDAEGRYTRVRDCRRAGSRRASPRSALALTLPSSAPGLRGLQRPMS
eukprot:588973-Rhodomonas_salina.2